MATSYTGCVVVLGSVAGATDATAEHLVADRVVEHHLAVVVTPRRLLRFLAGGVLFVIESPPPTTLSTPHSDVLRPTLAHPAHTVTAGERVRAVGRHAARAADATTHARRRRRVGVHRSVPGYALALAVGGAVAAGNDARAVGGHVTEAT